MNLQESKPIDWEEQRAVADAIARADDTERRNAATLLPELRTMRLAAAAIYAINEYRGRS